LENEYLGYRLADGPPPPAPPGNRRDHVGIHLQRDGRLYVGAAPTVGRLTGDTLSAIADLAQLAGSQRVALTPGQKIVVLDVDPVRADALADGLELLGLQVRDPSPFRRGTMACTGVEFCKLAIVETKARAATIIDELETRLPDFDQPLSIHVNGCPNSCARIQVADIGLKGIRALDADGNDVEGFQVHLGGSLGQEAGFGRTVKGLRLPAADAVDYIEGLLRQYLADRDVDEPFAAWVARADEAQLIAVPVS
jgi:sulfite reductase (ferredoxin)